MEVGDDGAATRVQAAQRPRRLRRHDLVARAEEHQRRQLEPRGRFPGFLHDLDQAGDGVDAGLADVERVPSQARSISMLSDARRPRLLPLTRNGGTSAARTRSAVR